MIDKEGYAPEGFVTDEIRKDLLKIGWIIKSYEEKERD
jgi:nucleoside-triphosphatase THEP1